MKPMSGADLIAVAFYLLALGAVALGFSELSTRLRELIVAKAP